MGFRMRVLIDSYCPQLIVNSPSIRYRFMAYVELLMIALLN
ncbi:hypothetical protein Hanom_Chr09g00853111 [Helianthus anomalus]